MQEDSRSSSNNASNALLNVSHLDISYNDELTLKDISFGVNASEILGIAGESGSGKSTLIKAVMGLLSADGKINGGSITYKNVDITHNITALKKLRGKNIAMVFQDTKEALCPVRTVESQLYECAIDTYISDNSVKCHKWNYKKMRNVRSHIKEDAVLLLEKMHIDDPQRVLKSYPFQLSGGMNQRVGIMLSMINRPQLILADEPTSALDVTTNAQVIKELKAINNEYGTAMIIVTHNIDALRKLADNVMIMRDGVMLEYGKTSDVLNNPQNEYTRKLIKASPKLDS